MKQNSVDVTRSFWTLYLQSVGKTIKIQKWDLAEKIKLNKKNIKKILYYNVYINTIHIIYYRFLTDFCTLILQDLQETGKIIICLMCSWLLVSTVQYLKSSQIKTDSYYT